MFGLGPMELGCIFLVLLLVLGPSRLPKIGSAFGETIMGFKKGIKMAKSDIKELEEEAKSTLKTAADEYDEIVCELSDANIERH